MGGGGGGGCDGGGGDDLFWRASRPPGTNYFPKDRHDIQHIDCIVYIGLAQRFFLSRLTACLKEQFIDCLSEIFFHVLAFMAF